MQPDDGYFGVPETCNRSLRLLHKICVFLNYIILLYILEKQPFCSNLKLIVPFWSSKFIQTRKI